MAATRSAYDDAVPDDSHTSLDSSTLSTITQIWNSLSLPLSALSSLDLGPATAQQILSSSFKVSQLAHATIALSALAASLLDSTRNLRGTVYKVTVPLDHAAVDYGFIGGLHKTADGYVRIHDSFPNHRAAALKTLNLPSSASREEVAANILTWNALDLESAALANKAVIYALRPFSTWSTLPQHTLLPSSPITIHRIPSSSSPPKSLPPGDFPSLLSGLRVLEFSRVIAAPVAGRCLAAHGADVLWVTSPNLPSLPGLDIDMSRGKRSIQLELDSAADKATLRRLLRDADVLVQSYRPGSLAVKGLSTEEVLALCPEGIVIANLSAWGDAGPWRDARGCDSMVQTVSGFNTDEADAFGAAGEGQQNAPPPARVLPVQALDHASGYLLATGIMAALWRRAREGGSWEVGVSLAGTGKFLRGLGMKGVPFQGEGVKGVASEFLEGRETAFGMLKAMRHAASVDGKVVGYEHMLSGLGSASVEWL